jgi:hypothetical protein
VRPRGAASPCAETCGDFGDTGVEQARLPCAQPVQASSVRQIVAPVLSSGVLDNAASGHGFSHHFGDMRYRITCRLVGDVKYLSPHFVLTCFQQV